MHITLGFIKLIESAFCAVCVSVHYIEVTEQDGERFNHAVLMCGAFVSMAVLFFGLSLSSFFWKTLPMLVETLVSFSAAGFMFYVSVETMVLAEEDEHLMYLTDVEERQHRLFYYSRMQSVFGLFAAIWMVMHGLLCADIAFIIKKDPNEKNLAYEPLQLGNYFEPVFERIFNFIVKVKNAGGNVWTELWEVFKSKPPLKSAMKKREDAAA